MENENILDFINAVSDANAATESYYSGSDVTQVEVVFLWQKVLVALDKIEDTEANIMARCEALTIIDALTM